MHITHRHIWSTAGKIVLIAGAFSALALAIAASLSGREIHAIRAAGSLLFFAALVLIAVPEDVPTGKSARDTSIFGHPYFKKHYLWIASIFVVVGTVIATLYMK